jgi:hypothetical protein
MSEAVRGYKPREFIIQSLDGEKSIDITNSILSIDYFEDILKPDISMIVQVSNVYSIVSGLPIRGGERVYVDLETVSGDFTLNTQRDVLYVYKVSGIDGTRMAENFTLHLTTREYLTNETSRCSRRYSGKISESVKEILSTVLKTDKYLDRNIEETSNAYSFIGSMKKPFNVLTWLGPKALSGSAGSSDSDPNGSRTEQATGTSGFFFFENIEGYNFRSIDGMVSQLKQSEGSADNKKIFKYSYGGKVIKANDVRNNYDIINFNFEKNIDLRKSLRVGMYSNVTFFYNQETHDVTVYKYTLKDQIKDKKLSKDPLAVSDELGDSISRILVRGSDHGIMETNGGTSTSGRSPADQAKSLARYNLLFTQALNILIPCNVKLKVGDIIYCEFPEMSAGKSKEIDPQTSGYYLIRELRHHFSANQNTTSLRLMRDSYGVN